MSEEGFWGTGGGDVGEMELENLGGLDFAFGGG